MVGGVGRDFGEVWNWLDISGIFESFGLFGLFSFSFSALHVSQVSFWFGRFSFSFSSFSFRNSVSHLSISHLFPSISACSNLLLFSFSFLSLSFFLFSFSFLISSNLVLLSNSTFTSSSRICFTILSIFSNFFSRSSISFISFTFSISVLYFFPLCLNFQRLFFVSCMSNLLSKASSSSFFV